jgi:hypothetical protein
LNLYSFRKIMRGGDDHPHFIRDNEELCQKMTILARNSCDTKISSSDRIGLIHNHASAPEASRADFSNQHRPAIGTDHPFIRMMSDRPELHPSQQMEHQEAHMLQETKESWSTRSLPPQGILPPKPANDVRTQQQEREEGTETSRNQHRRYSAEGGGLGNNFERYFLGYAVDDLFLRDPLPDDLEPRHFPPRFRVRSRPPWS